MVECAQCLSWVHATCEGISDEKYQILSYLPETVEFLCKICTPEVPALWSQAIDNEISNGIMNIVKNLTKYRSIKLSPNKRVTCELEDESAKKLDKPTESKAAGKCDNKGKVKQDVSVKKQEKVEERVKMDNPKKPDPPAEPVEPVPVVELKKPEPETPEVKKEELIRVKPMEEIKKEPTEKDPFIEGAKMKLDFEEGRLPELVVKLTDCVKQKAKATQTLKLRQIQEAYNIKECSVHLRKFSDDVAIEPNKNIISLPSTSKATSTESFAKPAPAITIPTLKTPDKNANYDVSPNKMASAEPEVSTSQIIDLEAETDCTDEKKNTSFIELEDETATENQAVVVFESPSKIPESGTLDVKVLATTLKKASLGSFKTIVSFDLEFKSEALKNKSDEIHAHYLQLITESFPWYKPGIVANTKNSDKQLVTAIKPAASNEKSEALKNLSQLYTSGFKDDRICAFCKKPADVIGNDLERMLHTGSAPPLDWVHANCALWSSEVWEDRDGYLHCVVPGALSRASRTKCGYCGEKGASVGCCQGNSCPISYHWPCALELAKMGDSIFLDTTEMALYCTDHGESRKMMAELDAEEKDTSLSLAFPLPRRLAVEPARNKKRYADPVCVEIAIGSIRVERLGLINSSLCYDETRDILVPIGYVAKRLFWSTKEPWRIVEYVIITELEMETTVEEGLARDINLTVEHGTHGAPPEVMEKNLRVLRHIQQQEIDVRTCDWFCGKEI
jgi:PHD-like zinc-binding domain/F/Y-rich N-terminus